MRTLNRTDGRDLFALLLTLTVMTIILRATVSLLTGFDISVMNAWLCSALALLILLRVRLRAHSRRK